MTKHNPEELHGLAGELDHLLQVYSDVLQDEPTIREPLEQARTTAESKYRRVSEREWIEEALQILAKHDPALKERC